ncbi:MAG TPA: hypothetical protein VGD65_24270 [Chryseosolibacter sp.]
MIKTFLSICLTASVVLLVSCSEDSVSPAEDVKTTMKSIDPRVPYTYESLDNGTVRLTFTNNTGSAITGDIIREGVSYLQNGYIIHEFSVADGATYSFVDDNVIPATYRYIFEYAPVGTSDYIINFDTVTVTTNVPALGDILLLPPDGGEAYETLRNGYQIQIAGVNIQPETDATYTKSVVFYLNDVEYIDSSAPFTLFPEGTADLQNGEYTLTAIAYPRKKGKGIAGDTTTVNFSVNNLY